MKHLVLFLLILLPAATFAQNKFNNLHFNILTEIRGTKYVMASVENRGKVEVKSKYFLFINTTNGATEQIDFPKDAHINSIEQIQIDKLGINIMILVAKTANSNGDKAIDWNDPQQIFILSTDGKNKTQLTDDAFFVSSWITNKNAGTITITGHYDSNSNGKHDKIDRNEILIYDLKSLKLLKKI